MKDEQIDLLHAELARAFGEAVKRFVIAVVVDPNLGLNEDVGTGQTRLLQRLADTIPADEWDIPLDAFASPAAVPETAFGDAVEGRSGASTENP